MSPDRPESLEERIVQALGVLEDGGPQALERFLAAHPAQASRVRQALAVLEARGLSSPQRVEPPREPLPERLGAYELRRPLGGGGMGVVYLAREVALEREVALKLVRPDQLHFPGARERFDREVRTIASLQHPGIVPLYGVGEERGLPYYAMELVRGVTLAELVQRLGDRDPASLTGEDLRAVLAEHGPCDGPLPPLFRGRWEEICLRIARAIAEALEHAHRRGVVHRDVKPSNVMLGTDGRVQLVDFGLSTQRGGTRITRSGSPLGSLAYMAPEMLRGEAREEDPRLDVWSLGVTLFELATLRLPFPSESEARLRQAVLTGPVPSVRRLLPSASWELETLVAVACDPDPARRYQSAGAFAEDLDRALCRRPLAARPPGRLLRARRWLQRHPVGAAMLGALVIGPSLLALQAVQNARVVLAKSEEISAQSLELEAKNVELAQALAAAETARGRAEENLQKALEAVDTMLTRVGDETLEAVPHFEGVRRRLLEDALGFYEWFLAREDRHELRVEYAHTVMRAAELYGWLGNIGAARRLLRETESGLESEGGEAQGMAVERFWLKFTRAGLARSSGDLETTRVLLEECRELLRAVPYGPDDPRLAVLAGQVLAESALFERSRGDTTAAIAATEQAIERFESVPPGETTFWNNRVFRASESLIRAYQGLAVLLEMEAVQLAPEAGLARRERSVAALGRAAELSRELLAAGPESLDHRFLLSRSLVNRAALLLNLGRLPEAEQAAREAFALSDELTRDFPSMELLQKDMTTAASLLAGLVALSGDPAEAERFGRVAVERLRALGAPRSDDPWIRGNYGTALTNLAVARWAAGAGEAVLEHQVEAAEQFDAAVRLSPGVGYFEEIRRQGLGRHAGTLLDLGRHGDAFQVALEHLEQTGGRADLLWFARIGAQCVDSLEVSEPDPAQRAELAGLYAELVAERLRTALDGGLLAAQDLESVDLTSLRQVPTFEALLGS